MFSTDFQLLEVQFCLSDTCKFINHNCSCIGENCDSGEKIAQQGKQLALAILCVATCGGFIKLILSIGI